MADWREPEAVEVPKELAEFVGGHQLVAETLVRRGLKQIAQVEGYLNPSIYQPASAFELPGMAEAVKRVEQAIKAGEKICVWGDFDVDGQTATAVLVEGLNTLDANVFHHIPIRAKESHGMNIPLLKEVIEKGASLVITCDTGIAEHEPLEYARSVGVDVVVTDHHSLPETLPVAVALVNSQMVPPDHPLRTLPGVGVAYKLVEALYERAGKGEKVHKLLDLVALGIVADLAGLRGDTRYLLQLGLKVLRNTERVGMKALFDVAKVSAANLNEETIGFAIGPRMNALGRLDDANPIVEFLTIDDKTKAEVTASRLEGLNEERRLITEQIFEGALAKLKQNPDLGKDAAIVLAQENWEAGIIGIVASRLVEQYHKPVILIALDGSGIGRGSARSVSGINITQAIAAQRDLLQTYGGHPMAAGLSIDAENIEQFRRDLSWSVEQSARGISLAPQISIDGYLKLKDISIDLIADLDRLGPFGAGNPALVFAVRDVRIKTLQKIGRNKDHLRLIIEAGEGELQDVLWWRGERENQPEGRFDLAFNLRVNDFKGERQVQVVWADSRPVEGGVEEPEEAHREAIQDYRYGRVPEKVLVELKNSEKVMVWGECISKPDLAVVQRNDLAPADVLAIWTVPPGPDEIKKVMEKVKPERIYLFGIRPEGQDAEGLLKRLAGLLKNVLRAQDGRVLLRKLAGATGQRETVVLKGLEWLKAAGHYDWQQEGRSVVVKKGLGAAGGNQSEVLADLQRLISETEAYRRFYMKAEVDHLIGKRALKRN